MYIQGNKPLLLEETRKFCFNIANNQKELDITNILLGFQNKMLEIMNTFLEPDKTHERTILKFFNKGIVSLTSKYPAI